MHEFVLLLLKKHFATLGQIRTVKGISASEHTDGYIWLRGAMGKDQPDSLFRKLPLSHTFRLGANEGLFPQKNLTPVGKLPDLDWKPIADFVPIALPKSALPAVTQAQVPLQLVRSEATKPSAALLLNWIDWAGWMETAPMARFESLHYAASENGEVLVIGAPLPPLPGQEYWAEDLVFLPLGFDLELPAMRLLLKPRCNADEQAILLFYEDGSFQKIEKTKFIPATRGGIRRSSRSINRSQSPPI